MNAAQALPEWINESLFRWIANNGLAVVFVILLLALVVAPLFVIVRMLVTNISKTANQLGQQISGAVTLFSATLSTMNNRHEQALDRVDDRLMMISDSQAKSMDRLADALNHQTDALQRQGEMMASMNESVRIQLNYTTQQMAQQAVLTEKIVQVAQNIATEPPISIEPVTGVIKPVTAEQSEMEAP